MIKKKKKKHRYHTLGLLKSHEFLVHLLQNIKIFAFVIYDKSARGSRGSREKEAFIKGSVALNL